MENKTVIKKNKKVIKRKRGFEIIKESLRKYPLLNIELPVRKTIYSAGYDFSVPVAISIPPQGKIVVMTDVKAYMLKDEVLKVYIRSSLGVKKGLILMNGTGVIDSDYYSNKKNDGNIGLPLHNTSNKTINIAKGDCIAQGIFVKYLITDDDDTIVKDIRSGGMGSTTKKDIK